MDSRKTVRSLMGGTAIILSAIFAIAGFIFFGGMGYIVLKEAHSLVWKGFGVFLIFCGLTIVIFVFGTMYLTFTSNKKEGTNVKR